VGWAYCAAAMRRHGLFAHVLIGKSNSVIEEFNVARHRPDVEAMLPCSGRSFAMGDLQDRLVCSYALRSRSAGRYLLLIDTKAGFCPNRIDSAKWRRLSHAFDASRRQPSRTTGLCNRGREASGRPDRALGVIVPKCAFSIPAHFKGLCEAAKCWRTSARSFWTGSAGERSRRSAARGGIYGDC
jgi:hypothetical protein